MSLVTENFTLRSAYVGDFSITGSVIASENAIIGRDADISGNVNVKQYLNVAKDSFLSGNTNIAGNVLINGQNVDIKNNLTVENNISVYEQLYFGNSTYTTSYLQGSNASIGVNTTDAKATLDIRSLNSITLKNKLNC